MQLRTMGTIDLGDHSVPCQIVDVSTRGLALLTAAGEPPLRAIRVRFQLNESASWTEVDGTVVRSQVYSDDGALMLWGVKLLQPDLGTRKRLRNFVRTEIADEQVARLVDSVLGARGSFAPANETC